MGQFCVAKRRIDDIFRPLARVCENSAWRMTFIVPSAPSACNAESVGVGCTVSAVVGVAVETEDVVQLRMDEKAVS